MPNSTTKIAKNSILLTIRMFVVMILSVFTTRFLLENLGIEDFGVYNVTIGIVTLCSFISPALSNATQRFYNFEYGRSGSNGAEKVFNTSLQIQLVMVLLLIIICETFGLWYVLNKLVVPAGREHVVLFVYQFSIFAFAVSFVQIPYSAAVISHERMGFFAFVSLLDAILKLIISICIAFSTWDRLLFYSVLLFSVNILNFLLYVGYASINFEEVRLKFAIYRDLIKDMLLFSWWNLFESIARIGKDQGSNMLINYYFGPVLNAARGLAIQVSYAFAGIVESTVMAARPQMIQTYATGNVNQSITMFYTLSKGAVLIIFLLSLPVFSEIDTILRVWIGQNIPEYSAEFIRLSIIVLLVDKMATPVTAIIHATGKVKLYHFISGVFNILPLPLAWMMFEMEYGPLSVYLATFICVFLAQIAFVFLTRHLVNISIYYYFVEVVLKTILVIIISSIIPIAIRELITNIYFRLVVVSLASYSIIPLIVYFVALNKQEKIIINNLIINKILNHHGEC